MDLWTAGEDATVNNGRAYASLELDLGLCDKPQFSGTSQRRRDKRVKEHSDVSKVNEIDVGPLRMEKLE